MFVDTPDGKSLRLLEGVSWAHLLILAGMIGLPTDQFPHRCGMVEQSARGNSLVSGGWDPYMVVHHIDKNRGNNSLENLKLVCPTCHVKEHGKEWGKLVRERIRGVFLDASE